VTVNESSAELLALAEALLHRSRPETAGLWPRASALLMRQSLEAELDAFWRCKDLEGLRGLPTHQQLICLRSYVAEEVAGAVDSAWNSLSRACHHGAFELAPTQHELARAAREVRRLAAVAQGLE
jgi:hypothetical protein